MTPSSFAKAAFCVWLAPTVLGAADEPQPVVRRPSIGIRIQLLPGRPFGTSVVERSTTSPVAEYADSATSASGGYTVAPTLEYRLTDRFSLRTEFRLHRTHYQQKSEMLSGEKDPNAVTDDRRTSTITVTTKANYWEIPLLVQYHGLRRTRLLSRAYLLGGMEFRHAGKIRTGNEYSWADGVTDYNETPSGVARRNLVGATVGIGIRFVDDLRIKIMPEVRYVRWSGSTFEGTAFHSLVNQCEAGIGVSF